jgi:hypothetical protein
MFKHWEIRHDKYQQKNKLLAVHLSPEKFTRALLIIDIFIKFMRQKRHDAIVEQGSTFALVDREKDGSSYGARAESGACEYEARKKKERDKT